MSLRVVLPGEVWMGFIDDEIMSNGLPGEVWDGPGH